jgi:hypothetical protein
MSSLSAQHLLLTVETRVTLNGGRLLIDHAQRWRRPQRERESLGDPMNRRSWFLVLGLALCLHNEEILRAAEMLQFMQSEAPAFLRDAHAGITVPELQGSLLILTAIALSGIVVAAVFSAAAASAFGMMALAALLGLNAFFHIVLFIQTGAYMPGLVTALLITLPISVTLLERARHQRWVPSRAFWAAVAVGVVAHGPVLDALFRMSLNLMRA